MDEYVFAASTLGKEYTLTLCARLSMFAHADVSSPSGLQASMNFLPRAPAHLVNLCEIPESMQFLGVNPAYASFERNASLVDDGGAAHLVGETLEEACCPQNPNDPHASTSHQHSCVHRSHSTILPRQPAAQTFLSCVESRRTTTLRSKS